MIKRITIGGFRLTFSAAHITKVVGVNSQLDDGRHVLMWDFDNTTLDKVAEALKKVQTRYFLSDIHILETKENSNFAAYCFTAVSFRRALEILFATDGVCLSFLKFCVIREHLTLRVTPKGGRMPFLVAKLDGYELSNCSIEELHSWVKYETLLKH